MWFPLRRKGCALNLGSSLEVVGSLPSVHRSALLFPGQLICQHLQSLLLRSKDSVGVESSDVLVASFIGWGAKTISSAEMWVCQWGLNLHISSSGERGERHKWQAAALEIVWPLWMHSSMYPGSCDSSNPAKQPWHWIFATELTDLDCVCKTLFMSSCPAVRHQACSQHYL